MMPADSADQKIKPLYLAWKAIESEVLLALKDIVLSLTKKLFVTHTFWDRKKISFLHCHWVY